MSAMFLVSLISCGGGAPAVVQPVEPDGPKAPKIERVVIKQSKTPTPDWAASDTMWQEGSEGGKVWVYLRVEAEDPNKDTAKLLADGQKIAQMADAIKQLATHEFAKVTEGMAGEGAGLETYVFDAVAAVSKNVKTGGALNAGEYWEYVQEIKGSEEKTFYRYVLRFKIDYNAFKKAMQDAWNEQVNKVKEVNPELKDKGQQMTDAINNAEPELTAQDEVK
ncbi:MAG: hypothetical protein A2Y33_01145 [Spirochaetes bacterium GWF1_51_8]|nr:MAG: hypothetical protein A2Y33_01145 [Spirochaetes bacterium GWF1_51_8]